MALSSLWHPRSQAWLSHPLGKAGSDPEPPKAAGISPLTPAKFGSDPPVQEHLCPCGKTVFLEFPRVQQFQSSRFLIFPSPPRFDFFSLFFSLSFGSSCSGKVRRETRSGCFPRSWLPSALSRGTGLLLIIQHSLFHVELLSGAPGSSGKSVRCSMKRILIRLLGFIPFFPGNWD